MKKYFLITAIVMLAMQSITVSAQQQPNYNLVWDTPSLNSGESMPCGGGDIGLNVWVENGDILFYIARSDAFDENNSLLKLGRVRVRLSPNPFEDGGTFRQELNMDEGCVLISGKNSRNEAADIRVWVDVFNPVIHLEVSNSQKLSASIFYENWRYRDRPIVKDELTQTSFRYGLPGGNETTKKDAVDYEGNKILFYHHNEKQTLFDLSVKQQGVESIQSELTNPLANRTFGGMLEAKGFKPAGTDSGQYCRTDYKAWKLESEKPMKHWTLNIKLHTQQTESVAEWKSELEKPAVSNRKKNLAWWKEVQNRSFIHIESNDGTDLGYKLSRNYRLVRYMYACNARGEWPTKFNGGLFTFDPVHVDGNCPFTPDYRNWSGGTFTAQNQRLSYFPMLKSGDFEWMTSAFEFYNRLLPMAKARCKLHWGHGGAFFPEQIDNFGLSSFADYTFMGNRPENHDKGVDYNPWLEYLWDTSLEFCLMILEKERYTGADISKYIPLIEENLRFFDEHYQYRAKQRGVLGLDGDRKLILYPGSGCETYKMALNSSSTIAALQAVTVRLLELPKHYVDTVKRAYFEQLLTRLPEIRTREIDGHTVISPAWTWERINNLECPQLYPVWPWGVYGIGKPNLETAINTFRYDPHVLTHYGQNNIGWNQYAIWAARLGLTDEAKKLVIQKLQDSGRKFPAYWGSRFNWIPDNDWCGSGIMALQEMLLQNSGDELLLLPACPKDWNVHFKLFAHYGKTVECRYINGEIKELKINGETQNTK
jgi:hypothetical protein